MPCPRGSRGDFTQALIELGAVVCLPRSPRCERCPWSAECSGLAAGSAPRLTVKGARSVPRKVNLSVALAVRDQRVLMRQRPLGCLGHAWILGASHRPAADASALYALGFPNCVEGEELGSFAHSITNTQYTARVYLAEFEGGLRQDQRWVSVREMSGLPLSTISRKALRVARDSGVSAVLRRCGRGSLINLAAQNRPPASAWPSGFPGCWRSRRSRCRGARRPLGEKKPCAAGPRQIDC